MCRKNKPPKSSLDSPSATAACDALCAAASLGGDTDTIAAMLGAILGACSGYDALPAEPVATIRRVNALDLDPLVNGLLGLRARTD